MNRTRGSKANTTRWYNEASTALNRVLPSLNYDFANNRYATNEIITNRLTYSQEFDNAGWSKTRASITPNTAVAPDGTMTADALIEDSTAAQTHAMTMASFTGPAAIGDAITVSIYIKSAGRTGIRINLPTAIVSTSTSCSFDLTTGGVTNAGSVLYSDMIPLPNGWWRCSMTAVATAAAGIGNFIFYLMNGSTNSYDGDSVSGLYIWGAQIEFSAALGKYVPTTSAAATTDFGMTDTVRPFYSVRTSNATMINSAGNLVYAPANMLLQSQNHDIITGGWSRSGINSVVNGYTAPDGSDTACKMTEDSGSSLHTLTQSVALVAGQNYWYTVYLKAAERTHAYVVLSAGGFATTGANIDLIAGTITTVIGTFLNTSISSAGNGWWRVGINLAATSAVSGNAINYIGGDGVAWADRTYQGDGASGILIWGSQFEYNDSSSPTAYYPTYTAAYYGPRLEYDPVTRQARGILNEEARTNVLTFSHDISNAAWSKTDVTLSASLLGITGFSDSNLVTEGSAGTALIHSGGTVAAGSTLTASVVIKSTGAAPVTWVRLVCAETLLIDGYEGYFNIATGAKGSLYARGAGTSGTSAMADLGNGWYRCSVSCIPNGSYTVGKMAINSAVADSNGTRVSNSTYGLDHGQLEVGAFPTSIIPTTGVAETRAVDNCYTYNTGWYSDVGTFVVDFVPTEDRSQVRRLVAMIPVTGFSDVNAAASNTAGRFQILSASGGGATDFGASTGSSTANNYVSNKGSILVNGANGKVVLNGGAVSNDAARAIPVAGVCQKMAIGMVAASTNSVSGYYIRSIMFYKDATASDLQLQAITV